MITHGLPAPVRPISFVCVRFSGEYEHNIIASDCIKNKLNQFVVVDNRQNLFFPNLGAALVAGIKQCRHDLICLVHEDVVLLPGWQAQFEASLSALEKKHPDWGLVGAVGWSNKSKSMVGHYSDPHLVNPRNTFSDNCFAEVTRLDEQIMFFRKSAGVIPDPHLPSIHNIGRDLARTLRQKKLKTFVIDAPTIHKFRDSNGKRIQSAEDSTKIKDRHSRTYKADRDVCDDYYNQKWGFPKTHQDIDLDVLSQKQIKALQTPLIIIGRGGSGTRLATSIALDCGVFMGNDLPPSGDSLEMAAPIYRAIFRKYLNQSDWHKAQIVPDIKQTAAEMLLKCGWPKIWGFKLPESCFLLDDLASAFPQARYLHFNRNPRKTVFRRTHMTARTDNHVGRVSLGAAYDYFNLPRENILSDGPLTKMAITNVHQQKLIQSFLKKISSNRKIRVSFSTTVESPERTVDRVASFLGEFPKKGKLKEIVDKKRAHNQTTITQSEDAKVALAFLNAHLSSAK